MPEQEIKIGYLFRDGGNNIVSVEDINLINSNDKTNDEFKINSTVLVNRYKIIEERIEKLDTTKLEVDDLLPLSINPFRLRLIGFVDDFIENMPILKKNSFYFHTSKICAGVNIAYRVDTDAIYPVLDIYSIQLAVNYDIK